MSSRICSKDLLNEGVLGWWGKEVVLFKKTEVLLVVDSIGKDVKIGMEDRGWGCTGDDVCRAVWDVEEGIILLVFKSWPDKFRGWGISELRQLGDNGLEDVGGDVKGTWVVPSIVRTLKDLKDGSSGVRNILLVDVIKGGPGGDRDVGKGGEGNGGRLRSVERHLILN